jgi:hypothetical protein
MAESTTHAESSISDRTGDFKRFSPRTQGAAQPLPLISLAAELPESQWSVLPPADQPQEQYTWVKHQPGECQQVQKFATVRWKQDGDLLWRYAYRVCQAGDQSARARPNSIWDRDSLAFWPPNYWEIQSVGLKFYPLCPPLSFFQRQTRLRPLAKAFAKDSGASPKRGIVLREGAWYKQDETCRSNGQMSLLGDSGARIVQL